MITITKRQALVLRLTEAGFGEKRIAMALGIDHLTAYCHLRALRRKGIISFGRPRTVINRDYRVVSRKGDKPGDETMTVNQALDAVTAERQAVKTFYQQIGW